MAEEAGDEITPLGEWLGARSPAGKSLPGRLVEYLLAAEENIDVDESRLLEEKLQGIKYNKMLKWWLATLEDAAATAGVPARKAEKLDFEEWFEDHFKDEDDGGNEDGESLPKRTAMRRSHSIRVEWSGGEGS